MDAIMMQPAACVCRSADRGHLNSAFTLGRVAQRERASAFEAEGCRVEPCRGRQPKKEAPRRALVMKQVASAAISGCGAVRLVRQDLRRKWLFPARSFAR